MRRPSRTTRSRRRRRRRRWCARSCRGRGAHDDITIVVVDIPPPKEVIKWAAARRAHPDTPTDEEGGDTPSPLAARRARRSVDQLVRDARRRSLDRGAEPPPEWAETREDQARANRGRKFDVQADVTVRRGLDAAFVRAAPPGGVSADASASAEKETRPASRPVNAGCLACLLGGGVDHSALADVDDVDAEEGASLRDDYVLGAVLGRGMYGSVRLAYLKAGRRGSRDGASEGLDGTDRELRRGRPPPEARRRPRCTPPRSWRRAR